MEYSVVNKNEKERKIKTNRIRKVELRLTELEYQELLKNSQEHKTVSDFIRQCCLEKKNKKLEKTKEIVGVVRAMTFEISAIGKNINQIARYSNLLFEQKIKFDSLAQFNPVMMQYTATLLKFEQTLKKLLNG